MRQLTSVGRLFVMATATSDTVFRIMNDWKALPAQLKHSGELGKTLDALLVEANTALAAARAAPAALDTEDAFAFAKFTSRVRNLRVRVRAYELRQRGEEVVERWKVLHGGLVNLATSVMPHQSDARCLFRLIMEQSAQTVPEPLPPAVQIEASVRELLVAALLGTVRIPAVHLAALIGNLSYRGLELQASAALAMGVLTVSPPDSPLALSPSFATGAAMSSVASPPFTLISSLMQACGTVRVRNEAIFSHMVSTLRGAIQAGVLTPKQTTQSLSHVVTLYYASAGPAVVVGNVPHDETARVDVTDLLSVTAATLTPKMLELQYARKDARGPTAGSLGSNSDRTRDEDSDDDDDFFGMTWTLRQVVSLLIAFVYVGDVSGTHRRFVEQLVSTSVALMDASPRLAQEVKACSQLAYALRILDTTPVGPRLRALVPPSLIRLCDSSFASTLPPPDASPQEQVLENVLAVAAPEHAGAWVRQWAVPGLGVLVDLALPAERIIAQYDGPTHFVFARTAGGADNKERDDSKDRAQMLTALTSSMAATPGEQPDAWGVTTRVLQAGGYEMHYCVRSVRLDTVLQHMGYSVLRIPYGALVAESPVRVAAVRSAFYDLCRRQKEETQPQALAMVS